MQSPCSCEWLASHTLWSDRMPPVESRSQCPGCRERRSETSRRRKSSIGGIEAPQSINQKNAGCARFPESLGAVRCEGCRMRKSCRRVQPKERKHGRAARRTASDRQTDYDSQYCNCNDNATDPYADQPLHAVAFALRHVGAKLFHVGAEPFQSAFILRLMRVHLFPQRRQFLGNLMGRRLAHRPIPVARRSSGAHRARRRIANPFGANGRFILPDSISLSAGRPSVFFAKARRGRRQLARRSRARTDHRAAHPASPSPPGIFSGRAIGASRSFRSGGCDAKSRQFEEAKPTQACEAASGGEQSSRQLSTCRTSEPKKWDALHANQRIDSAYGIMETHRRKVRMRHAREQPPSN